MRKLKLYIATSLDSKISRPDGTIDWLPDPTAEDYGYQEFLASVDTLVMGFKTYEICRSFGQWPYPNHSNYVFTRNAAKTTVPEAKPVTENPADFIKDLLRKPGKDIWLMGGGEIIALLHDAGLIDEYIIAYIPVILGEGIELFPGIRAQVNLQLIKHSVYKNGVVILYLAKEATTATN